MLLAHVLLLGKSSGAAVCRAEVEIQFFLKGAGHFYVPPLSLILDYLILSVSCAGGEAEDIIVIANVKVCSAVE